MKSMTKKLMLSILTVAFAFVALGTSTFAWLALSSSVQVAPVEWEVIGTDGLEMAVTLGSASEAGVAKFYTGEIPASEIYNLYSAENFKFTPVTRTNSTNTLKPAGFYKINDTVNNSSTWSSVLTGANTDNSGAGLSDYIHLKFWIKCSSEGKLNLVLNADLFTSEAAQDASWECDRNTGLNPESAPYLSNGGFYRTSLANSARILFNCVEGSTTKSYQAPEGAAQADSIAGGTSGVPATINNTLGYDTGDEKGRALSYFAAKTGNPNFKTLPDGLQTDDSVAAADSTKLTLCTIGSGGVTVNSVVCVEVTLWIEGFDAECFNAIFNNKLTTKFGFEIAPVGA